MAGIFEQLGQGLQTAGGILSPEVYREQAIERQNSIVNLANALKVTKEVRSQQADAKFREAIQGIQPGMSSSALLEKVQSLPPDILADSPSAQGYLQNIGQLHQQEVANAQRNLILQKQLADANRPTDHYDANTGTVIRTYRDGRVETIKTGEGSRTPFEREVEALYPRGSPEWKKAIEAHIARMDAPPAGAVQPENPASVGKTGEEYLKTLPESEAALVKKVAAYEINPNSLSNRGGHRERILGAVSRYSPDYNQQKYGQIDKAIKDFNTGKQGNSVRAFNVALEHLDTLSNAGDALKNRDTQALNRISNVWTAQTGQRPLTDFNAIKQLVADEIVKAIVGSGGGVQDREEAAKTISAINSPEQLEGVIERYKQLFGGQIKGLEQQYKASTGLGNFREKYLTGKGRAAAEHEPGDTKSNVLRFDAQGNPI